MIDMKFLYKDVIETIKSKCPFQPHLALILGSGLGDFINSVNIVSSISTEEISGYPVSTIPGHAGKIHFAVHNNKNLLIFQGRIHLYEGYNIDECLLPVWTAYSLGCKRMIITNAGGGINSDYAPGDLMLANSFNGISLKRDLAKVMGLTTLQGLENFRNFLSAGLNELIKNAAAEEKINLKEGVYWYTRGPSYETPAEIKMMSITGADAVGMSTVHEAVFSAYLGMETSAITCITNFAAGLKPSKLSHSEVTKTADMVKDKFNRLLINTIKQL